jgi:uncharacterized membrane protein YozB (DUF420 family)
MVLGTSITNILNAWAQFGVFSYVLPFLLVFAIVFGILQKSEILGENKAVNAIISLSIGLLSLQFDIVPNFFANLFPKFGVGLSVFLVLIILIGLVFKNDDKKHSNALYVIGVIVAVLIVIWALSSFNIFENSFFGFGWWFSEYFWPIVILAAVVGIIAIVVGSGGDKSKPQSDGS